MPGFRDTTGLEWNVHITYAMKRKLREAGWNVQPGPDGTLPFPALVESQDLTVECLWAVCREEAERRELTRDDFEAALDGPTIEDGVLALMEAAVDFTHPRETAGKVKSQVRSLWARATQQAAPTPTEPGPSGSNASAANSRDSQASTPAP